VVRKLSTGMLPPSRFGGPTMTKAMIHVTWHMTTIAFLTVGTALLLSGSVVHGAITAVKPAPNPRTPGTLTLSVTSVTVRGASYPLDAAVDSLETIHKGRGVTSGDAAKVGAGAVAGAVLGRVLGGNKKGTIIGGVVGGIAGAGVASQTKDSDIVLPAGAHIIIRLTKELAVAAS